MTDVMALPIRSALRSASRYVVRNPFHLLKVARHAANLQVAIPLDALRWFVANTPPGRRSPTDVVVTARPPAVHMAATLDLMGTKLRASAAIKVDELRIHPEELRLQLRLSEVEIKVLDRSETPIAGLIKSGALDLSKPGNLANFMPKRPAALIDAHDDVIVLDLMKMPKVANNFKLRKVLERLTPVINVSALRTDDDFLIVALRATPMGFPRALTAARF
jgi:hypothetical protein